MYRLNAARWLAVGFAVVGLVLGSGTAPATAAGNTDQARVVELLNAERAAHGLPPLTWENRLATAASSYAGSMAGGNFFSHTGPDGSDVVRRAEAAGYVGWSFLGENLAAGQPTPERVVAGWMNSPGHRANVLAPSACEVGIGHAYNPASKYGNYWSMETGC
jgi:uncharacterized protein YkwD